MSQNISPALAAHYASGETTLAQCWLATLKSGAQFAFTAHDTDIIYGGASTSTLTYLAATGFDPSAIQGSEDLSVDNLEVHGMLVSPAITEADLRAGLWDYATIDYFEVNYKDLTMGHRMLRSGTLGQVSIGRGVFVAELRGLAQKLQQNIGELYSPSCRVHQLGDSRCKISLAAWTVTGNVTAVISRRAFYDTSRTETTSPTILTITGITNANPGVVQVVTNPLSSTDQVAISGVAGMTEVNGGLYTITYIDSTHFSIGIDTSVAAGFGVYTSGGTAALYGQSEYFQNGLITMDTGLNAGIQREVKFYHPGYIELFQPFPYDNSIGDAYTMIAGCDRQFITCRDRFANYINFRGEPHVPGVDRMISGT